MPDHDRPRTAPNPPRGARFRSAALAGLVATLAAASPAPAQDAAPAADAVKAARLEWLTQLARQDAARAEVDRIPPPGDAGKALRNIEGAAKVLAEVRAELDRAAGPVRTALNDLAAKARARRAEAEADWAEVTRQRVAFRQYAEKQQERYGFDFDSDTPSGFRPNAIDAALLVWALVTLGVALRLRQRERRLGLRKARRAAAAALLVGLAALPGCGPSASADARPWAAREEADLTAKTRAAAEQAARDEKAADDRWRAAVEGWANMVGPRDPEAATDRVDDRVRQGEADLRDRLRAVLWEAALAERLARDADDQRAELDAEKAKLDGLMTSARWRTVAFAALRVLAAAALLALCVAPFWAARRARARARRRAARTCPRCTAVGTLRVERVGAAAAKHRGARGRKAREREKAEDEDDDDREVVCSECGLRFRRSYLKVPRLCFPTVGVRSSGKTHMLATAYDRIVNRTAPTVARLIPAASADGGAAEKRFEEFITLIMTMKGEAGGTDIALPDPVLIQVKDTDPAGANTALVNLFDYSGELVNPHVDVNKLRKTAVRMDGFMLFLDPTQLYGDRGVTLTKQLGMLNRFLSDMQRERKVPMGEVIPVPVAVCVPKFDLLLTENPIGGQSVPFIRHMLEELTPGMPEETTLETVRARSDLVEQMLPLMFPGVDVRKIVEGYFGRQVMFFPLTSVNLIESELGEKDLSARSVIIPYGVAEPIVWLLHMHGYEVFAR